MPRRTGKIKSPDAESVETDGSIEKIETEEEAEHTNQEDAQEDGQSMLGLKNMRDLIFLGRLRETVDIGGFKFSVTTLTASQQRDILRDVMRIDDADRILDLKLITVSYVVDTVNGLPLEEFCEDETIVGTAERRLNVVNNFQASLLEKLYQVYENLTISANEEIGLSEVKK